MSRSMKSNISVGKIKAIWNTTLNSMDYFKKSARGKWILCNPWSGKFVQQGPGLDTRQVDKLTTK